MEVNLKQAIKLFYSKSSFDMIYQEAVANALDAGASNVNIILSARSLSNVQSFKVIIEDNGIGFTEERYGKFCRLLDIDSKDKSHRGLGRLAYLFYFDNVMVQSTFENTRHREFQFNQDLKAIDAKIIDIPTQDNGTKLILTEYCLDKIGKVDYADVEWIKICLLKKYYSRLYLAKQAGNEVTINISSEINGRLIQSVINGDTLPVFEEVNFTPTNTLEGEMTLFYSIKECDSSPFVVTALSIDDRNESIDVFADESVPQGYEMVFILFSDSFQGQTDPTRQSITLSASDIKMLKKIFRSQIIEILSSKYPKIIEASQGVSNQLNDKFPHLSGYFENDTIGISSKNDILKDAQNKFFQAQREMLSKTELSEKEFEQSLDLSGRALTEYIVFRQLTIDRLKKINKKDLETTLHNILVPQRTVLNSGNSIDNVYKNCSWIFDDKFMTYSTVLSEMEMSDLIANITNEETGRDADRPDIAIIFSDDPKTTEKVEVVIIELKKKGLKPEENVKVEVQLEKRARKLYHLYPNKIQRIWLYGVTELDNEYKSHLSTAGYHPLYSKGTVFVNTTDITVDWDTNIKVPAVRYVMDLDALIDDADARNKTFLNIIKSKFSK